MKINIKKGVLAGMLGTAAITIVATFGSLFGIGATTGRVQWNTLTPIPLSWIVTLPVAAVLGYLVFFVLEGLF